MQRTTLASFLLIGCADPDIDTDITVVADSSTITLGLQNPTLDADPLAGVTGLRLEVVANTDEIVASESFNYPDDTVEMNNLIEYGVVRFQLAGTDGGDVVSFGRSAEVVLTPGQDLWVPIVFLPINQFFGLAEEMALTRSEHSAVTLPDGRLLLMGGHDPTMQSSYDQLEIYDPQNGVFSLPGSYVDQAVAGSPWVWTDEGQLLFIAGEQLAAGQFISTSRVYKYDPLDDSVVTEDQLTTARRRHCAAQYIPSQIFVLGGPDTGTSADMVYYDSKIDSWTVDADGVTLRDGLISQDVTACMPNGDGRIFVQGTDIESTGIWDGTTGEGAGASFDPITKEAEGIYVSGPLVRQLEQDLFWVAGGVDQATSEVIKDGQEFRMGSATFVEGTPLSAPRQRGSADDWLLDDWLVVGCGYSDALGVNAINKVELLNPVSGEIGPILELDRARPGCRVNSVLDGALLVTGGYDQSTELGAASAAIAVPYWED